MAELNTDVRAIRRNWWIVILAAALGAALGAVLTLGLTPKYRSSLEFFVQTPSKIELNLLEAGSFAQERATTYVSLLSSESFADQVLAKAPTINLTRAQVLGTIAGKNTAGTVLVDVTVVDTDANRSLVIANAISTVFPAYIKNLEKVAASPDPVIALQLTSGPTLNKSPISPIKSLNIAIGLLVGLLVGLIVAIARGRRDRSLRSPQAVLAAGGTPVLGAIALDAALKSRSSALVASTPTVRMESVRRLRAGLPLDTGDPKQVILVTSPRSRDGKTTSAVSLAASFAETGRSVVLVEADLRRPALAGLLGLKPGPGLTDVLVGRQQLADVIQSPAALGIKVLTCGAVPGNPAELLGSAKMVSVLSQLRRGFDVIVVDAPAVLPVADALVLGPLVDGVIVLVRNGVTTGPELQAAIQSLRDIGAPVLGPVLNMSASDGPDAPLGMAEVKRLLPQAGAELTVNGMTLIPGRLSDDRSQVEAGAGPGSHTL